jgi:hypothetical protein
MFHGAAGAVGLRVLRTSMHDVVPKHFYSPIPNPAELSGELWERPSALRGIDFDVSGQAAFLEGLAPLIGEFGAPFERPAGGGGFHFDNDFYSTVEAEVAYAIVRRFKPRRVIELGSGYSSLVLGRACDANERDGSPVHYAAFDPYPSATTAAGVPGMTSLSRSRAQDVPLEEFKSLGSSDVLFVDTTHTVKIGGDVNYLILDVLPTLADGVLVHFHDIFLPWEYPRHWVLDVGRYWAEQYLLQAFLSMNPSYEVVFAAHALLHARHELFERLFPSFHPGANPSAFWIRRKLAATAPGPQGR